MVQKEIRLDYFLISSAILLSILVFSNLGNQYLWQDEAENAVIAQNIIKFGYPKAFDGSLLVVSDIGYRGNHTWIFQPWLQNYVTAASFLIFGKSTFSARMPFALFGISSYILSYLLAKRLFSIAVSRISSVILLTCVPYLLMIRQARYYSLALFFGLAMIYSYLDYIEKRRGSEIKLITASFLLFNSNFGIFFPLVAGLCAHYLIFHYRRSGISRRDILVFGIIAASTLPVFIYFKGWLHKVPLTPDFILGNIKFYLRSINRYIVPLRFFVIVYAVLAIWKRRMVPFRIGENEKMGLSFIILIFAITVAFLGAAKFRSLRYAICLIPLAIIFISYFLYRLAQYNKALAIAFITLLITTDIFHHSITTFFIKPVRSYFFDYLYEITHDYDGPIEGIVRYLKANAKPCDRVMIPYGDCAVAFYTDLKVTNRMELADVPYPEWIVRRVYWASEDFYNSREVQKNYDKIVLDYPDLRWENRPDDIGYHNFRTVRNYPEKVVIYKKRA